MENMLHPLKAVCVLFQIKPDTLRKWEARYGVVSPRRAGNRFRLYTDRDLERLAEFAKRLRAGEPPSRAAKAMAGFPGEKSGAGALRAAALSAVKKFDGPGLDKIHRKTRGALGPVEALQRLWLPLVWELASAAEEKPGLERAWLAFAAARLRERMVVSPPRRARPPRLVLAGTGEGSRELPLLMTAAALARKGVGFLYLGTDVSDEGLAAALRKTGIRHLYVGLGREMKPPELREWMGRIVGRVPGLRLFIGGPAALPLARHIQQGGAVFLGAHLGIAAERISAELSAAPNGKRKAGGGRLSDTL